jgi:hypothetical protein
MPTLLHLCSCPPLMLTTLCCTRQELTQHLATVSQEIKRSGERTTTACACNLLCAYPRVITTPLPGVAAPLAPAGVYCQNCNCLDCSNVPEKSELVMAERQRVLQREPMAFTTKVCAILHAPQHSTAQHIADQPSADQHNTHQPSTSQSGTASMGAYMLPASIHACMFAQQLRA